MLRLRLLTGLVLAGIMAYAVLVLSSAGLGAVLAVIALAGAWEWSRLVGLVSSAARGGYVLLTACALWIAWWMSADAAGLSVVLGVGVAWWLAATFWLAHHRYGAQRSSVTRVLKAGAGLLTLVPAWTALVGLHAQGTRGAWLVLFLLALIWVADSSAYFTGRRWGRTKLAPALSPGKTRAGVYGALGAVAVYAAAGGAALAVPANALPWFIVLCLLATAFSVVGDLFESMMKRHSGVKDSGTLVPGHGGVLDRIDSITAAAPVFLLGLRWLHA